MNNKNEKLNQLTQKALVVPFASDTVLQSPAVSWEDSVNSFIDSKLEKAKKDIKEDEKRNLAETNFLMDFPKVCHDAGYLLLAKLFAYWMLKNPNDIGPTEPLEVEWTEIEESDEREFIKSHIEASKLAIEMSLLPGNGKDTIPNLSGFRSTFLKELLEKLTSFANSGKKVGNINLDVYEIYLNRYSENFDDALKQRIDNLASFVTRSNDEGLKSKYTELKQITNKSIPKFEELFSTSSRTESEMIFKVDKILATLGRFALLVNLDIEVRYDESQIGTPNVATRNIDVIKFKAKKINFIINDSFDFKTWQPLGIWTRKGFGWGNKNNSYILYNHTFEEFRKKTGIGRDFMIRSSKGVPFESKEFEIPSSKLK